MVQLTQIITADASAFLLLVIVKLYMSRQVKRNALLDAKLLTLMMNLTMFQCFFDVLVFWIDGKTFPLARELNYLGNMLYFTLNMTISFLWPLFAEYKINSGARMRRLALLLGIPLALCILLVASAPLNGLVFTVTADNLYARAGLHIIPTLVAAFYLLFGTIRVYGSRGDGGKYMIFPAIYFITPVTLAIITQTVCYGISLILIGIAIGLTGVYLSTQSESAYIDQLCGVFNRRYYNDYIRAFCNAGNKESTVTGVLIDMDNFKAINDEFGHDVGDKALVRFSSILREHINSIGFAVRCGGDEFILITREAPQEAERAIEEIARGVDEFNASGREAFQLAFSYGIAQITADNSSDDFFKAMDNRMYDMKRARKVQQGEEQ